MATAVCAVRSVRLLTMTRSSLLALSVGLTVLLVLRPVIAKKDPTCVALQKNEQQIWALGGVNDRYMLITSGGNVFTDIPKSNLVKSGRSYTLTIDQPAKIFKEAFPYAVEFSHRDETKLFIADLGHGPILGMLKKIFNFRTWVQTCPYTFFLGRHFVNGSKVEGKCFPNKITDLKWGILNKYVYIRPHIANGQYINFIISNSEKDPNYVAAFFADDVNGYRTCLYVYLREALEFSLWLTISMHRNQQVETSTLCFYTQVGPENVPTSGMYIKDHSREEILLFNINNDKVGLIDDIEQWRKGDVVVYETPMSDFIVCKDVEDQMTTMMATTDATIISDDLTSTTDGGFIKKHGSLIIATLVMIVLAGGVFAVCCWRRYQDSTDGQTTAQTSWFSLPTFGKKKRKPSYKPRKLPVSTDTSTVFAVAGRTSPASSSNPSTASKAGPKATDPKTSKFSFFTTAQSIVSSLVNKIANALGRKSKVNKASNAPKTSMTSTPTTTSPALRKSKFSKSKVSKVSTALIASRASPTSKKSKNKKKPKSSRTSGATVVCTITSIRKTSASFVATLKDVKKKIKKKSKK